MKLPSPTLTWSNGGIAELSASGRDDHIGDWRHETATDVAASATSESAFGAGDLAGASRPAGGAIARSCGSRQHDPGRAIRRVLATVPPSSPAAQPRCGRVLHRHVRDALKPASEQVGQLSGAEAGGLRQVRQPAIALALIGVFVSQAANGAVRVAVTGAGNGVFRSAELEKALSANFTPDAAGAVKVPASNCNGDIHASAEYRAHLVSVMAKRAVAAALG